MNRRIRTGAWVLIMAIVLALLTPAALATEYEDGVYKGSAQGFMGDVKVKAAVVDGKIALITSDNGESDEVGKPAINQLIDQVMEAQDPDVDAVAGATETSEAFIAALKGALTQAGWVEEGLPEITIITRQPVAKVSEPTIGFGSVQKAENGVSYLDGDMVIITWDVEGEVQGYRIVIRDENDSEVKRVDTSDTRYIMEWSELSDSMTYTVTVTAIPRNGTLKANGVSTSAQFALYVAPEPTPTPEPLLQTGKISDSWDEIIAAIDDGSARQRYAVGATKELNLGRLGTIHMQLAGFDLDERADGSGKAATTWIAVELLPNTHVMNENWTAEGGWEDSDLRAYLQNTVLPAMPSTISKRLVWVRKKQKLSDGDIQFTEDKLWIPDRSEIFGSDALYYDLFHDTKENPVKTRNGSAAWWWLRSAYNYYTFYYVSDGGYTNYDGAGNYNGVALGFCL